MANALLHVEDDTSISNAPTLIEGWRGLSLHVVGLAGGGTIAVLTSANGMDFHPPAILDIHGQYIDGPIAEDGHYEIAGGHLSVTTQRGVLGTNKPKLFLRGTEI
jgi:hypothetical protein